MRRHTKVKITLSGLLAALFVLQSLNLVSLPFVTALNNFFYDMRLVYSLPEERDERIVIIDIDERSLAELGRWPWGRDVIANLTDRLLNDYFVSVIGFDVIFSEADHTTGAHALELVAGTDIGKSSRNLKIIKQLRSKLDNDAKFASALDGAPVVLGFFFDDSIRRNVLPAPLQINDLRIAHLPLEKAFGYGGNLPLFQRGKAGGFLDRPVFDGDGLIRRARMMVSFNGQVYPSFSLAILQQLNLADPEFKLYGNSDKPESVFLEAIKLGASQIPVDSEALVYVPYRHPQSGFKYVSAVDVLQGKVDKQVLDGAIVLVGSRAAGMLDLRPTPVANIFPGVEIHANIISAALDGRFKHKPSWFKTIDALFVMFCALLVTIISVRFGAMINIAAFVLLEAFVFGAFTYSWTLGYILMPGGPALFVLVLFSILVAYAYILEQKNRHMLGRAFGRYVPPELVEKMRENPEVFSMQSENRELTVLFSDIRGFTSISEKLTPEDLSRLMRTYLSEMTRVIYDQQGTIDKYIGDAIMAFWGAPVRLDNHARNAVICALEMQQRLTEVNARLKQEGLPEVAIGIGLNSGMMNVGDMGSEYRVAYTVLGDAVNLASRLEGMCKKYGVGIVISDDTRLRLGEIPVRYLDRVRVVGKRAPVLLYEPIGINYDDVRARDKELKYYKDAMRFYLRKEWKQAYALLSSLSKRYPDDKLYSLYKKRIKQYVSNPPPEDWDGVFDYTSK